VAAIVLRKFSGMAPSANPKHIAEGMATYAKNLNLRFNDFRPMPAPTNAATVTAGGTLYKFDGSATFITKTGTVSFVRGPIATDITERTYYTGDGAPKVMDITLASRQLGVPTPATAPTTAVNQVDEYSEADEAAAKTSLETTFVNSVVNNQVWTYDGVTSANLSGLVATSYGAWDFHFVIAGTLTSGTFTPTNAAHRNLLDPRLGYYLSTVGATTTARVPLRIRGARLSFGAGMQTAIAALANPKTGAALLTSAQVTSAVTAINDLIKDADSKFTTESQVKLTNLKDEFIALANSADTIANADADAVKAFYARADVTSAITQAKTTAATSILNAVITFNTIDIDT
jgi:hypothetical protein